ncbi:MAG TPA: hypothetical protein VHP83_13645 [Aggregatilineaceae bacterium]|nr:hypothetical protein [Aggregatilineaceae bacterium]
MFRLIVLVVGLLLLAGCSVLEDVFEQDRASDNPPATVEPESYKACGCGCCLGIEPLEVCLYHAQGNSLSAVIAEDQSMAQSPDCAFVGCAPGVLYRYCD